MRAYGLIPFTSNTIRATIALIGKYHSPEIAESLPLLAEFLREPRRARC